MPPPPWQRATGFEPLASGRSTGDIDDVIEKNGNEKHPKRVGGCSLSEYADFNNSAPDLGLSKTVIL